MTRAEGEMNIQDFRTTTKTSAMRCVGRLILVAAALSAFWLNVMRAEDEGVFKNAPFWVLDAVPAALTNIFAPSAPRYTISDAVADAYLGSPRQPPGSAEAVNSAIAKVTRQDFTHAARGYALLGNDDKGIVDFVELAFRVFGLRIESVAIAYYALLLLSSLLFCWRYWNNCMAMVALTSVLFAEFQILPYLVFNPQLTSPLALRCIPIISVIACLHCALHYWRTRATLTDLAAVFLQALLIVFVLNVRSTAIWQPLLLLGFGLIFALRRWRDRRRNSTVDPLPRFMAMIMPSLLMVIALAALNAYRALAFPAEYSAGEQITTRVIWHNIYSGFALHPRLAAEHALRIDDMSELADVGRALKQQGKLNLWQRLGGETPNFSKINWAVYDPVVGEVLVELCRKETRDCLETFLIYKPYYFFDTLLWFYGLTEFPSVADVFVSTYFGDIVKTQVQEATAKLRQRGLTAAPWGSGFVWLLLVLAIGALIAQMRSRRPRIEGPVVSLAAMALMSTAPSMIGYPAPHGMANSVVAINATLQFAATAIAVVLLRRAADFGFAKNFLRLQPRRT